MERTKLRGRLLVCQRGTTGSAEWANHSLALCRWAGPTGDVITRADLPPATKTMRWVTRRKVEIVIAVHGGLLSLDEACMRYGLTSEEFSLGNGSSKARIHRKQHLGQHGG